MAMAFRMARPRAAHVQMGSASAGSKALSAYRGPRLRCAAGGGAEGVDGGEDMDKEKTESSQSASLNDGDGGDASLESEFTRVLRVRKQKKKQEMETRWKQGGLRPRVVHESTSEWIRRVAYQYPHAVLGTASGAVLVSNCEELGGLEYSERARRLVAAAPEAHAKDWDVADDRGLGERSLMG